MLESLDELVAERIAWVAACFFLPCSIRSFRLEVRAGGFFLSRFAWWLSSPSFGVRRRRFLGLGSSMTLVRS